MHYKYSLLVHGLLCAHPRWSCGGGRDLREAGKAILKVIRGLTITLTFVIDLPRDQLDLVILLEVSTLYSVVFVLVCPDQLLLQTTRLELLELLRLRWASVPGDPFRNDYDYESESLMFHFWKNRKLSMYGQDILSGTSRGTFEIQHKIAYPYIEKYDFTQCSKCWEQLYLMIHIRFSMSRYNYPTKNPFKEDEKLSILVQFATAVNVSLL